MQSDAIQIANNKINNLCACNTIVHDSIRCGYVKNYVTEIIMDIDNTDYKIILEALYQLAVNDADISDDDVSTLDDTELEQRLLKLRQYFSRLERKSSFD